MQVVLLELVGLFTQRITTMELAKWLALFNFEWLLAYVKIEDWKMAEGAEVANGTACSVYHLHSVTENQGFNMKCLDWTFQGAWY